MSGQPFRSIAVLGPGLIGGSLLLAMRSRYPDVERRAWVRRPSAISELRADTGLVDFVSGDVNEVVLNADCIVLAMPTGFMRTVVEQMKPFSSGGKVLVTDVGSVKNSVVREIAPLVAERGGHFIGSHPMAGSEKKGLSYSDPDLFEGAAVILTPNDMSAETEGLSRLTLFWENLGGVVSRLSPARHDEVVAAVSHLPHLVAAALIRSVLSREPDSARLSGGGFRDTTRVAGGPEEMWSGILSDNRDAVSKQLGEYIRELESWKDALDTLDSDRLLRFLSEARQLRESF